MKALLLIAHGSRRDASNREVFALAEKITAHAGNEFDLVKAGFLELAKPGIELAVSECADLGIQHVTVIPYFLSAGRHVVEDVPRELARAARKHREMSITVCPHIGAISAMPNLLLDTAREHGQTNLNAAVVLEGQSQQELDMSTNTIAHLKNAVYTVGETGKSELSRHEHLAFCEAVNEHHSKDACDAVADNETMGNLTDSSQLFTERKF